MSATRLFLGLDVGTQAVRAALFDPKGDCKGHDSSALDTTHPSPTWAEQDASQWWQATKAAVAGAMAKSGASAADVAGLGLGCTACTVIPCAADGTPLRRALLWVDHRAFREAEQISASGEPILQLVSNDVSPEWMLPKALWLKRNEPALFDGTQRLVECTDWMMHRLTGRWTLSLNNATVKWNYSRPDGGFSEPMLARLGLYSLLSKWPSDVVPLARGEGTLTAQAAAELGLKEGTPVAQGGVDAYLGMIGLGAVRPGELAMILGSSTCLLGTSARPVLGSGMLGCFPDAVTQGLYVVEGGQASTGATLNWYCRHLAGNERQTAQKEGRSTWDVLDEQAQEVPPGCDGLVALDYWQGNRCPIKDPRARGVWWGLSLSHGPGHLYRSLYEAMACGTRHIVEDVQTHGYRVSKLIAGGGGARSRLWLSITADVLGRPIRVPRDPEACARGAAMAAAVRSGEFADLQQAAEAMVQSVDVIEPTPARVKAYDGHYQRYRATYPALRALMHSTA